MERRKGLLLLRSEYNVMSKFVKLVKPCFYQVKIRQTGKTCHKYREDLPNQP